MSKPLKLPPQIKQVIPKDKVQDAVHRLADYLVGKYSFSNDNIALVGIQTRGVVLANRIAQLIKEKTRTEVSVGELDITLYRDDLSTTGIQPTVGNTNLDFEIDGKQLILIDDVLFTGRTIRAALDEIIDFGRPKGISLAVLVDRGHREFPIQAEFASITLQTKRSEFVNLYLDEVDKREEIVVSEAPLI